MDPEVAEGLEGLAKSFASIFSSLSSESVVAARAAIKNMPAPTLSGQVTHTDHEIPGREHAWLRIYRPEHLRAEAPCIYWMHGGGLILGSADGEDLRFDHWCQELGVVGVSVDYRLAPEYPYPIPIEDCYEGLRWIHRTAHELGIDPERIGIGGSSAGGGLAACLGLLARDRDEFPVAFQALVYPMLDDRQHTTSSQWDEPVWPPHANEFGWRAYLGDAKGTDIVEGYAAAARATDLSGLSPTLICVGALDGFSDENTAFATALRHAGVSTELHVYPGAPHGFDAFTPDAAVAKQMNEDLLGFLRRHTN
jgi:acetyl esterase/lipase